MAYESGSGNLAQILLANPKKTSDPMAALLKTAIGGAIGFITGGPAGAAMGAASAMGSQQDDPLLQGVAQAGLGGYQAGSAVQSSDSLKNAFAQLFAKQGGLTPQAASMQGPTAQYGLGSTGFKTSIPNLPSVGEGRSALGPGMEDLFRLGQADPSLRKDIIGEYAKNKFAQPKQEDQMKIFNYIEPVGSFDDEGMVDESGAKVFEYSNPLVPGVKYWKFKKSVNFNPASFFGGS